MTRRLVMMSVLVPMAFACPGITLAGTRVDSDELRIAQVSPQHQQAQSSTPRPVQDQPQVAPGVTQGQQAQVKLSNELRTVQAVERMEQTLATMAASLKVLIGKVDALSEQTRMAHDQLREDVRAHTVEHRELSPNQRWGLVYGGQAILDRETGLVWKRTVASVPAGTASWWAALEACRNDRTGGRGGWHLPSVEEITSLHPIDPVAPFTNIVKKDGPSSPFVYWTSSREEVSSPQPASDQQAYWVSIKANGALEVQRGRLSNPMGYFCVRGNWAREP